MRSVSGDIRFVWSYPLTNVGHVKNFEQTPPDKDVRRMNVTRALVCRLSGSHAHAHSLIVQRTFCPFFIRYIFVVSVKHPLHVRYM